MPNGPASRIIPALRSCAFGCYAASPAKPIRFWFEVSDQDLFYPNPSNPDGMHDWTFRPRMAQVLADKGYHFQFLLTKNARHVDRPTVAQTLPAALEWLWKGYPSP
jgi:hypothetical protein